MSDVAKPRTLYKFRSWQSDPKDPKKNHHRTLLTERKLWVPTAADLNDPFDCCIPFRFDLMPLNELVKRFENMLPPELSRAQRRQQAREKIRESGIRNKARKRRTMLDWTRALRDKYGVLSFATVRDVPLLWSHYADAYRGYCIGIDIDQFMEVLKEHYHSTKISFQWAWVEYVNEFPVIVPSIDKYGDLDGFLESFTTKSVFWDYEKEYRYVFSRPPESGLILSPECVSEVIFGSEMPEAHKEEVTKVVREQFPSAKLLLAQRKFSSFELEFVPV